MRNATNGKQRWIISGVGHESSLTKGMLCHSELVDISLNCPPSLPLCQGEKSMPRTKKSKPYRPSKKVQAAMDAAYAARQAELAALAARDAATPPWLLALRQYIDAAIAHYWEENYRDEEGYTSSDSKGEAECEALWTQVVLEINVSLGHQR